MIDEYKRGFQDGCAHMKEDYEAGRRLESRADLPATDAQSMANPNVQALVEASRDLANVTDDDVEEKDAVFAALAALEADHDT